MARTKTRRTTTKCAIPSKSSKVEEEEEEEEESLSSLVSLLASTTTSTLQFLSSSDLLLLPSQSLSLSSLLRHSSLSLSTLLSLLPSHAINIPPPHPHPSSQLITPPNHFSWFRASSPPPPPPPTPLARTLPHVQTLILSPPPNLTPSLLSLSTSPSPIPPDHKLAAALFRLAHSAPFPFLARRFSLSSPALACRAFYEVCKAISDSLAHLFELSSDLTRILQGFNWMSLTNCCGVLSFTRFPVRGDLLAGSLTAQCLIDSEGRFLDVSVGWLGFMQAGQILTKTKLFTSQSAVLASSSSSAASSSSFDNPSNNNGGRYFIGGSCCPLLPWLLTPYKDSGSGLSAKEEVFNTVHARGMELADRAFGRLRARWKILKMEWTEECAEALPYVVVATCLLHNYLIKCSEPVVVVEEDEEAAEEGGGMAEVGFGDFEGENDESGERIRNMLALHLSQVIHK